MNRKENFNVNIYVLLSPWNPVRRVEWYKKNKPKTYAFIKAKVDDIVRGWTVSNGKKVTLSVVDNSLENYIANVEAILEDFPNRLEAFHELLNEELNKRR